jgi:hypothetical protein
MTDRELLELAAKAAGIELVWSKFSNVPTLFKGLSSDEVWNPLTNDGDALRLAVKLGMRLELDNEWRRSHVQQIPNGEWFTGPHNDDPYAATRRAIVRAAAEIGRSME